MALGPLATARPDRLAVTLFGSQLDVVDLNSVWSKAGIPDALQSTETRTLPIPLKRGVGGTAGHAFEFIVLANRADLAIGPLPPQQFGPGTPRIASIPDFQQGLDWLFNVVSPLLEVMPSMYRLSVQASFVWDFSSEDKCSAFMHDRNPVLKDEPNVAGDFIFQVNHKVTENADTINRIVNWQSSQAQGFVLSTFPGTPSRTEAFWVSRLGLDVSNMVSTSQQPKNLSKAESSALLKVLFGHIKSLLYDHK